jgi:hypothetical protein
MVVNRRALDRAREIELDRATPVVGGGSRVEAILNAVVPQSDGIGYIQELNRLWEQVRDKFLAMGEYLELAKANLPHGHYEMMFADTKREQPSPYGGACLHFNSATGSKLRAIYRATRDGRIPRESLPNAWGTAYELTKLTDAEFTVARTRGLIRQDVYRSEILSLMRELRAPTGSTRREVLIREREDLVKQMHRIRNRLVEIEEEIGPGDHEGTLIEGYVDVPEESGPNVSQSRPTLYAPPAR